MNVVLRRRVVVVIDVRADAVHQRGVERVQTLRSAENPRSRLAGKRPQRANGNVYGWMEAATDGAPHIVDEGSPCLVADIFGNLVELAGNDILGERFGLGHSKVIVYVFGSSERRMESILRS